MTAPTEVDIGTLIERRSDVYHGRAVLKGTRTPVFLIAEILQQGADTEELLRQLPHLDRKLVLAGLTYYLANQELVDAEMAEEIAATREASRSAPTRSPLRK
jgi:uncharacterized protein (DUF433 family)